MSVGHEHAGDKTPRGWFRFPELNIDVQSWHGVVVVFNAKEHWHGSTRDGFSNSYADKGSFKYEGALYMNARAKKEAEKEAARLPAAVVPGRCDSADECGNFYDCLGNLVGAGIVWRHRGPR